MNKQQILSTLTPEIVAKFQAAIEIGKWEDGSKLSDEQRQTCMQAVLIWEHEFVPVEERTGYIQKPIKEDGSVVGSECDIEHEHHYPSAKKFSVNNDSTNETNQEQPVKFFD